MSNCDFNRPCDCSDCRETIKRHICPNCGFPNVVSIMRDSRWVANLKHGSGHYEFEAPTEPVLDLNCYSCGYCIKEVGYYTSISETGCQNEKERLELIRDGKTCDNCSLVEGIDWVLVSRVQLREYQGRKLCQKCLIDNVKHDNPDPSDKDNKYEFNQTLLKWALVRVRIACTSCGKGHLVSVKEQKWRTRCRKCYSNR